MRLYLRNGSVLYFSRDNDEFAFLEQHMLVTELHPQSSLQDQKQLILNVVMVPYELILQLDQLHHLSIQFTNYTWIPVVFYLLQLLGDSYLLYGLNPCQLHSHGEEP